VKIQVGVFLDVTSCSVAEGYPEDGGRNILRNVDILPQQYTETKPRTAQGECIIRVIKSNDIGWAGMQHAWERREIRT
jgi:hypothetical protein